MALKTNAEMLEITQKAIIAVMQGGQEYNAFGLLVRRADLGQLQVELKYFKAQVDRESRGGIRSRRVIPYP